MAEINLKLKGSTTRYLQSLIKTCFTNQYLPAEVCASLNQQIVLQIPSTPLNVRKENEWGITLEISEENLLTLLTVASLYDVDESSTPVGAELFVAAKKTLKLIEKPLKKGGKQDEEYFKHLEREFKESGKKKNHNH